jgi:hypothetical protein
VVGIIVSGFALIYPRIASKIVKRYDKPKTPYRRILESPDVSEETKLKLTEQYKSLNPFELRKALEVKLKYGRDTQKSHGACGVAPEGPAEALLDTAEHLSDRQVDETLDFMEWMLARRNKGRGTKKK